MSARQGSVKKTSDCQVSDSVNVLDVVCVPGGTRTPTYKAWWSFGKRLDCYVREIRLRGCCDRSVKDVQWALRNMMRALWANGYGLNPKRVGQVEVDFLCGVHYAGRSQSYIANNLSMLKTFLKWAENKQISRIRWPVRTGARPNASWLSDDEARHIRAVAEGVERILVHCELDLGLRRIEVLRLGVSDFRSGRLNTVSVLGKGRHGGKPRVVHWHPDTAAELEGYQRLRDAVIAKARAKNPDVVVPDSLLVYERAGAVLPYKKSALDNIIAGLARRTGLKFTHHTLRRTCGRMMARAGVQIENIASIFGHSDTKMTLRYLGLDLEDQRVSMAKYAEYQKAAKIPGFGIPGVSQINGGPCGI